MRKTLIIVAIGVLMGGTGAFSQMTWPDGGEGLATKKQNIGVAPRRTEFVSYEFRENAEKGALDKDRFYTKLDMGQGKDAPGGDGWSTALDVPVLWLDRDVFLHVEGLSDYRLYVNEREVGYGVDARTPAEFDISGYVTDGENRIRIVAGGRSDVEGAAANDGLRAPNLYVYSQPKLRIEDFLITAEPDSTNDHGLLTVRIAVTNGYNFAEKIRVGYDIYSPQGKLENFDYREVTLSGQGRDTVVFTERIYSAVRNLWSAEKPSLYYGMVTAQLGKRPSEYIPYKIGFGKTEVADGTIMRNGKAVEIKAVSYNAAADAKTTDANIGKIKKQGYNTICVDYPQPEWFYGLCDKAGVYVIDRANMDGIAAGEAANSASAAAQRGSVERAGSERNGDPSNRNVGGSPANDPELLGAFLEHTEAMFARVRNHTCIIGWSLGGEIGNGYNLYKTYQWLKAVEPSRAVVYDGADGEWNSDMAPIRAVDAAEVLAAPAPKPAQRRR